MKTKVRRILAAVMAATMAVGMASTGVSASAASIESEAVATAAVEETVSPRYAKAHGVNFTVTSTSSASDSLEVIDAPAKLSYYSCSLGQARITISINGVPYNTYIIPEVSAATISHTIPCSAGDVISYSVVPDYTQSWVKAKGSFTLYI